MLNQQKPEEAVRQKSTERWQALIEGRLETAYEYETPEYRELYSLTDFKKKTRGVGIWQKVDVENVTCETEKCDVTVRIYVKMKFGSGSKKTETNGQATENWILHTTGRWYHVSDQ